MQPCGTSDGLARQRQDLGPALFTELDADDAVDACPQWLLAVVDQHAGAVIEAHRAAVVLLPRRLLGRADHHRMPHVATPDALRCRRRGRIVWDRACLLDDDDDFVTCARWWWCNGTCLALVRACVRATVRRDIGPPSPPPLGLPARALTDPSQAPGRGRAQNVDAFGDEGARIVNDLAGGGTSIRMVSWQKSVPARSEATLDRASPTDTHRHRCFEAQHEGQRPRRATNGPPVEEGGRRGVVSRYERRGRERECQRGESHEQPAKSARQGTLGSKCKAGTCDTQSLDYESQKVLSA